MQATKEENNRQFYLIFKQWRLMDALGSIFALVGLILAVINYELDISKGDEHDFNCAEM